MTDKNVVAQALLEQSDYYLVIVPDDDSFKYVWVVRDEEQKKAFQEALREFVKE